MTLKEIKKNFSCSKKSGDRRLCSYIKHWDKILPWLINPEKCEGAEELSEEDKKFYCEYRDYEVTYRKTCKNCIIASVDEDGNFYCPYYKD